MANIDDVFLQNKNINLDSCWKQYQDFRNEVISDYVHYNTNFVDCKNPEIRMPDSYLEHTNLRGRPGYGWADACLINNDSMLRINPNGLVRDKCNIPLQKRVFTACPSLLRGSGDPDKELSIISGSDSLVEGYQCKKKSPEMTSYHITPLLDCVKDIQNPTNIIPPWVRGGEDTRLNKSKLNCSQQK